MRGVFQTWGNDGVGTYRVEGFDRSKWTPTSETSEGILAPGFVDIHIHGGFGIDFMASSSPDEVRELSRRLGEVGYEAFLPTTVTASPEAIQAALSNLPNNDPRIVGFHLEGPFLSPKHPGAQPVEFLAEIPAQPSDWDAILADPRLRVITLAPEIPNALDLTRRLTAQGVIVSAGHTDATFEQATEGRLAGVRHTTHTFNAMRPLHHREAGTVGFALADPHIRAELIYDRIHVSTPAARILLNAKGTTGWVAVSDATMAAGLPAGTHIKMWNLDCIVGDREVRLPNGTLAGSGITLLDAFVNLATDFGLEAAFAGTSWNPRAALGLKGEPKVWVQFSPELELQQVHSNLS